MSAAKSHVGRRVTFQELFDVHERVEVPIIQRDYAQGRETAVEVRSLFLDALAGALSKEPDDSSLPLDLDFVYGSIEADSNSSFCPLDGQQRLTTLFLLHWYLAWADGQLDHFSGFAGHDGQSRFAYAIRASSGEFFDSLIRWKPDVMPADTSSLRSLVEDQPWFFQWWKRDPTIQSALTILDELHETFVESSGMYERLVQREHPYITFQLLDLANFGLSDDLYIKMNARGKPLTSFETFKALLEKHLGTGFDELGPYKLRNQACTVQQYFSHRVDGAWADLFWVVRDRKSNSYDAQAMNLVQALAVVSRDPNEEDIDDVVEELSGARFAFKEYLDRECLDLSHIGLLVTVLDACSGKDGAVRTYLASSKYYDEERTFRRILDRGSSATYADLVQFSAYVEFLREHGDASDPERFAEWMRVVNNLTINSNIERPMQFVRAMRSLQEMLSNSHRILEFLAKNEKKIEGFSLQQVREERIKAILMAKGDRWREAIHLAERHGYFKGQIEFLLDFSGVLDEWKAGNVVGWGTKEEDEAFANFTTYMARAFSIFDGSGLVDHGRFRTERALLSFGDYLLSIGKNKHFLDTSEDRVSWKRLLRGESLQQAGPRRGYIKQVLDNLRDGVSIAESLDEIINAAVVPDEWRAKLVKDPRFIEYCIKRCIRIISPKTVYLLKGERRSGDHVELFSYELFLKLAARVRRGDMAPFSRAMNSPARTDTLQPKFYLACSDGERELKVWIYTHSGNFVVMIKVDDGEISDELLSDLKNVPGFKVNDDGEPFFRAGPGEIEDLVNHIQRAVAAHVA